VKRFSQRQAMEMTNKKRRCRIHSSYLVFLRISSSTLSGPILPTPDIERNFRRRSSHLGLPHSAPIDDGLVNPPVVLSTQASRRASSRAGHLNRPCVLVIFGGPDSSPRYISSHTYTPTPHHLLPPDVHT
jgi:hypothetical protein